MAGVDHDSSSPQAGERERQPGRGGQEQAPHPGAGQPHQVGGEQAEGEELQEVRRRGRSEDKGPHFITFAVHEVLVIDLQGLSWDLVKIKISLFWIKALREEVKKILQSPFLTVWDA